MSCEVVLCDYHCDLLLLVGRVVYYPAPLPGDVHGDGLPPVLDLPHLLALLDLVVLQPLLAPPLQCPGEEEKRKI